MTGVIFNGVEADVAAAIARSDGSAPNGDTVVAVRSAIPGAQANVRISLPRLDLDLEADFHNPGGRHAKVSGWKIGVEMHGRE